MVRYSLKVLATYYVSHSQCVGRPNKGGPQQTALAGYSWSALIHDFWTGFGRRGHHALGPELF